MIIAIICLVIGIVAFAKGKMAVTAAKEIRGGPLYASATLLCLPLPLSFGVGVLYGLMAQGPVDRSNSTLIVLSLITTWGPILAAIAIGFIYAQPKLADAGAPGAPRGFDVNIKQ